MGRRTGWKEPSCSRSTRCSAWGSSSLADLALTFITAVWGSIFSIVRSLFGDGVASPLALVAVRMAVASALLLAFMAATPNGRAQLRGLRGEVVRAGTLVGTLMGVGFLLQIEGLQRTTASRSGFLTGTLVVLVPLIELAIFRKRPALPATVGVMLALVGITVLSAPWSNVSHTTWAGDALTLGCALVFAAHVVALGRVAAKHPVSSMLLLQLDTTGVLAALAGPMMEAQHLSGTPHLWLALLYMAVFAALWAALFIGERLTLSELTGGAIIVLGVVVGETGAALQARARAAG